MFQLNEKENTKLTEWLKTKDLTKYAGCSGGRFSYIFTPTSLGCAVRVRDNIYKDEIDITDFGEW